MTHTSSDLSLAADFPSATREQWLALVDGALKGAPFEKRLVSKTYDGLRVEPLYPSALTAEPIAARPAGTAWQILQRVDHPDAAAANAEALHDLENGATGLSVVYQGAVGSHGYGITTDGLAKALAGVRLDGIALEIQPSVHVKDLGDQVAAILSSQGVAPAAADIRFGFDPIGQAAVAGGASAAWSAMSGAFAHTIKGLVAKGFKGPFAVADGRVIHDAGGSEGQELAYVLSVALAYVRALEASGTSLDDARRQVFFRLSADAEQFLTIAKFRALRKLWARVEAACGLTPVTAFVSAETAWRMTTKRDPAVNMLRTTVAVFAAGVAGANAITVLPFTAAIGLPDRLARRIARNTQLTLLEESYLAKVADPAAGAGGPETLTTQLVETAWKLFQEIEAAGGVFAALSSGLIQGKVTAVKTERAKAIASRKEPLTGVSEFPNINEPPIAVLTVSKQAVAPVDTTVAFAALAPISVAAAFEALRDASDAVREKTCYRPRVFLANLGRLAEFTGRATFAKNFFEAGGIEAVMNDGFFADGKTDLAALVKAFKEAKAELVCLCSSDEVYGREAVEAAKALAAAGAKGVYLAGRAGEKEAEYKAAGIGHYIYMGADVLGTLTTAQKLAGAA